MPAKLGIAIVLTVIFFSIASAAEWQYCIAPANDELKIYMSGAFHTDESSWKSDELFDRVLVRAGLHHDVFQCPRAESENAIMTMLQEAVAFNRKVGRKTIYVRWEPAD